MPTLYEIENAYQTVLALMDEDLDEDQQAELDRTLDRLLGGLLPEKVDGYCAVIASLQADVVALEAEGKRLKERSEQRKQQAGRLKERLLAGLQTTEQKRVQGLRWTVWRQNNTPSVVVVDEASIPAEYWVQPPLPPPRLDKVELARALKTGKVDGAELKTSEHLRIK